MGWFILSFGQNFLKWQRGYNHIAFRSKLSKNTILVERYYCLVKTFVGDYMDWTIWSFDQNFQKKLYRLMTFSFHQNLLKRQYELNHIVFFSKFTIRTTWVDRHSLLIKYFQKDYMVWTALCSYQNFVKRKYRFNRKKMSKMTILFEQYCCWVKTFLGGYMERTVWSFDQKFQKKLYRLTAFSFHQNLLKRQYELYELNHIVFFSKFTIRTTWVDPHSLLIKYF